MPQNNVNLVRRLFEDFWNKKNLKVADEILSSDCHVFDPNSADFGTGPEAYKKHASVYMTAFPDAQLSINDLIDGGEKVAVRWTANATHMGELQGISPTNKRVEVTGTSVCQCSNGKISKEWLEWDALGLMRQLGALPQAEQPRRVA